MIINPGPTSEPSRETTEFFLSNSDYERYYSSLGEGDVQAELQEKFPGLFMLEQDDALFQEAKGGMGILNSRRDTIMENGSSDQSARLDAADREHADLGQNYGSIVQKVLSRGEGKDDGSLATIRGKFMDAMQQARVEAHNQTLARLAKRADRNMGYEELYQERFAELKQKALDSLEGIHIELEGARAELKSLFAEWEEQFKIVEVAFNALEDEDGDKALEAEDQDKALEAEDGG